MSLIRFVPLVSLALVLVVLGASILFDRSAEFPFTEPPEGADLADVDLGLGTLALEGLVVDDSDQPVPDAGVTAYQAGRPLWTWTGADGTFELTELDAGPLRVLVNGLGFEATGFDLEDFVGTTSAQPLRFVLDRRISQPPDPPGIRIGPLTGAVDFGPLAEADRDYEVLFMPVTAPDDPNGGFPCRQTVRRDGSFDVDALHAGTYRVILLSPDDRGARGPDLAQRADGRALTFEHVTGGDVPLLEVESTAGAIRGVVFRESTADDVESDQPIRGGLVRAELIPEGGESGDRNTELQRDRPGSIFRAQRTDEGGTYVLRDLAPGRYRVTVVAGPMRETREIDVPERTAVDLDVTGQ